MPTAKPKFSTDSSTGKVRALIICNGNLDDLVAACEDRRQDNDIIESVATNAKAGQITVYFKPRVNMRSAITTLKDLYF